MLSLVDREKNIFCYLLKNKNESEYMYVHNTFLFLMLLSCVGDRNSHCISELSMNEHAFGIFAGSMDEVTTQSNIIVEEAKKKVAEEISMIYIQIPLLRI